MVMRNFVPFRRQVGPLAVLVLALGAVVVAAAEPLPAVQKTFQKLLGAIQAANREAFVAEATEAVKQAVTQQVLDDLNKGVGARLKKGYKAGYLCALNQRGLHVYLWKLTFTDQGDDVVVRIALKDGKVDGFFLQ